MVERRSPKPKMWVRFLPLSPISTHRSANGRRPDSHSGNAGFDSRTVRQFQCRHPLMVGDRTFTPRTRVRFPLSAPFTLRLTVGLHALNVANLGSNPRG